MGSCPGSMAPSLHDTAPHSRPLFLHLLMGAHGRPGGLGESLPSRNLSLSLGPLVLSGLSMGVACSEGHVPSRCGRSWAHAEGPWKEVKSGSMKQQDSAALGRLLEGKEGHVPSEMPTWHLGNAQGSPPNVLRPLGIRELGGAGEAGGGT